jgi:hypothetical protein
LPKIPYTDGEETVGDSYPSAPKQIVTIDCEKVIILIKNTHASNALLYKIVGYLDVNDLTNSANELVSETNLAAGGVAVYSLSDPYEAVALLWKNALAGSAAKVKAWVNTRPRK